MSEQVKTTEKTESTTTKFTVQQNSIKSSIEKEQTAGSYHWHEMTRAGIRRRIAVSRYQISQLLEDLEGRASKKYRKHYEKHAETIESIAQLKYTTEEGKNNYKEIRAQLSDLEAELEKSAELVGVKRKQFKTKSKAVRAKVADLLTDEQIAELSDEQIAETYREAM